MRLVEAVDSVLDQTVRDFELIIVDDGSTDNTASVLADLASRDSRIRIIRHTSSLGAPAARNAAIGIARGQFITGLDDDDLMLSKRLEHLVAAWTGHHSLVCSAFWRDRGGKRCKLNRRRRLIELDDLLHFNLIGNQALMLTDQVRAVGGFDVSFVASQDYDLWVRMIQRFGSAIRIEASDYIVRETASESRISRSAASREGAVQFTRKHERLMAASHLRSQRLLRKITAGEMLRLSDSRECFAWASALLFIKYWLKCFSGALSDSHSF